MSSTAEYDGFGPWIYEIRTREEIPRLFSDYPLDLETAVLTIKVPRVIDRRDANPAMDLYDILLSLGPDKLTVLTRTGREYSYRDLPYSQVQGITESTDLLKGTLTLAAEDGDVEVAFNSSSAEIIAHLVKLLRTRYVSASAVTDSSGTDRDVEARETPAVETDMQNYHSRLAKEGLGRTVALQKRHIVTPAGASLAGQLIARAWPTTLPSAIFALEPRELQVIHRGRPFFTGYKPVHALARTLIPLERVSGVETHPNPQYDGVGVLTVRVGKVAHEFSGDQSVTDAAAHAIRDAVLNG